MSSWTSFAAESSDIAARLRSEFTDVLGAIDATSLESVLQLLMEQKSKLEEMISNVLKASSETESGVIENLK